jgi:flavodoxin I
VVCCVDPVVVIIMGCFDCQGALKESLHTAIQKKLNLSDEHWAEMVRQMTGHPSLEDMEKAKAFVKNEMVN